MLRTIIILLLLPITCIAQSNKEKSLTDTTIAFGIVKAESFVSSKAEPYCQDLFEKQLSKGTLVLIVGIDSCMDKNLNAQGRYYEIICLNQLYFINASNLLTKDSYYDKLKLLTQERYDSFRSNSIALGARLNDYNILKAQEKLESYRTKGIGILDWEFYDESEYTEGTSVKLTVYNPTKKTIKYIWFTFLGLNPVGDKVTDRNRGTYITMKGIGPLAPSKIATYEFDYVWFTDIVEKVKIIKVKVQYMDGTIKLISDINGITLPQALYEVLNITEEVE